MRAMMYCAASQLLFLELIQPMHRSMKYHILNRPTGRRPNLADARVSKEDCDISAREFFLKNIHCTSF